MASIIDDPTNPYFLHEGDCLGALLVFQSLIGENFHTWIRLMTMMLIAKNKYAFVDASLPQPTENDHMYVPWIHYNTMVLLWIINSLSKLKQCGKTLKKIFSGQWSSCFSIKERHFQFGSRSREC